MLLRKLSALWIALTVLMLGAAGCQQPSVSVHNDTSVHSVYGVLSSNPNYSTLVHLIDVAKFDDILKMPGSYTIFAPTNDAFRNLPPGTVTMLEQPQEREKLRDLLWYHIAIQNLSPGYVQDNPVVKMGNQDSAYIVSDGTKFISVNRANIVDGPIVTRNATFYGIDEVIIPSSPGYPGY
jgi:uncharacterized surface protein with fasciclin (FAS1) repeats